MWGSQFSKQEHYAAGRDIKVVNRRDIDGVCACGYLTLAPTSDFEEHNGGLTVKRSRVEIIDDNGNVVEKLRPSKKMPFNRYGCCNACVNDWR